MPTADQLRATVDAYVDAYARDDRDAFLALWAPDGVLEDPVGTPAHVGIEAIAAFWDGARALAERIELLPERIHVGGDQVAMVFEIRAYTADGGLVIKAVDVMRCDDEGRLVGVAAYWDMAEGVPMGS